MYASFIDLFGEEKKKPRMKNITPRIRLTFSCKFTPFGGLTPHSSTEIECNFFPFFLFFFLFFFQKLDISAHVNNL